jgi:hypothetical protein
MRKVLILELLRLWLAAMEDHAMGDAYQKAVSVCIIGRMQLYVEENADENVLVAARLQRVFMNMWSMS